MENENGIEKTRENEEETCEMEQGIEETSEIEEYESISDDKIQDVRNGNKVQEQVHEKETQESKTMDNNESPIKRTESTRENDSQESEENEIHEWKTKEDDSLKLTRADIQESKILIADNESTEKMSDKLDSTKKYEIEISLSATEDSKACKPSLGDALLKITTNRPMNVQVVMHTNPPVKMDFKQH
ncbi:hypothetical protein CDAR_88301 [Caerostris darwini]|uniref:Uncharacterized protein n=1 Tax=Caerostris darwini TaxID=1538125 RepID=A0AAV4Q3X6_9ARAC|nr:hypothetical protein CDAR_88301 [Caerostris darwini]